MWHFFKRVGSALHRSEFKSTFWDLRRLLLFPLSPLPVLSNSRISPSHRSSSEDHTKDRVCKVFSTQCDTWKGSINNSQLHPYVLSINVPRGCLLLVDLFFFLFFFVFFLWPRNQRVTKLNETFIFHYFKRFLSYHHKTCQLAELESLCQWVWNHLFSTRSHEVK